jgi:hypothetical protein
MNTDLIISLAVVGVSALVLHFKSHLKFIALGLFVGLVAAQNLGLPLYEYLAPRFGFFSRPGSLNGLQLLLLLIPAVILGINHSVDKKRSKLLNTVFWVAITTLFLLANILVLLPLEWQQSLIDHSVIALQLKHFHLWLTVLMAILIVFESFQHKKKVLKEKKAKRKKK